MKKLFLSVTAALLIGGVVLCSLSKPAEASGQTWKLLKGNCKSDSTILIKVCGVGTETSCTPEGECPGD